MQYLLLIHDNEKQWESLSPSAMAAVMKEFSDYTDTLKRQGRYLLGHQLHPTSAAVSLRVRNGALETIDGPFAETKEQLGGFYMIEAKDMAEARTIAATCPGAKYGTLEIRPVVAGA